MNVEPSPEKEESEDHESELQDQIPLLQIDVNLGGGWSGKIMMHMGENPFDIAKKFAQEYSKQLTT